MDIQSESRLTSETFPKTLLVINMEGSDKNDKHQESQDDSLLEVTCIFLLMIPMAYIYVFMHGHVAPVSRGFFCDDQNLKHPEVEEKVTKPMYVIQIRKPGRNYPNYYQDLH